MSSGATFPYVQLNPAFGSAGSAPLLPVTLSLQKTTLHDLALVDSGAAVCIIPYSAGLQLGGNWNQYKGTIPLAGALGQYPAKPLFLDVAIASFQPVQLVFAWSQSPYARLILGQTNFFELFDVCFFRKRGDFQIQPSSP